MLRCLMTSLVAGAAVFTSVSASAASTTLFTGSGGVAPTQSFTTGDGVQIDVSAKTINRASGLETDALVGQYSEGLGVARTVDVADDRYLVSGSARTSEIIWFDFSEAYQISGILFSYADGDDEITIYSDGGLLGVYSGNDFPWHSGLGTLSLNVTTSQLGILAFDGGDEFMIRGFAGQSTAVPTPSAALAGLSGLIALAARRRNKLEA